ncbi:MAG: hypothetical protein F6K00_04080 [Leptolyngbya sp. SIOISBB]|nr:hypothetical protein [Leptolyngbya sp. SIOISBB]
MMPSLRKRNTARSVAETDRSWLLWGAKHGVKNFWRLRMRAIAGLLSVMSLGICGRPALSAEMTSTFRLQFPAAPGQLAIQTKPLAAGLIAKPVQPTRMIAAPITTVSESELATDAQPPAPSVVWLIVMPAVPIVGGALIYLSRRLLGKASGESRLLTHAPIPEPVKPQDADPPKDP